MISIITEQQKRTKYIPYITMDKNGMPIKRYVKRLSESNAPGGGLNVGGAAAALAGGGALAYGIKHRKRLFGSEGGGATKAVAKQAVQTESDSLLHKLRHDPTKLKEAIHNARERSVQAAHNVHSTVAPKVLKSTEKTLHAVKKHSEPLKLKKGEDIFVKHSAADFASGLTARL